MNLPPPPKRFYESLHALNNATEKVAKVSMALAAAETLSFNNGNPNVPVAIDGLITKLKVLDLLNIQPGFYTCRALQEADHARIRKAEKAISRRTKEARIKNRQLKCRQEDDLADDPSNPSYGSVFSDESRFHLCPDDYRRRVWRRPWQNANNAFTTLRHTGPQQGFMV
ncbi:hypothetical protein TNCV_2099551 [Trichonephila clavipes]|nr:hypothetical protein TNCV_2099551 [Trichonephila clavipes]